MTLLLRFITRTQLVRFRPFTHRLTTPIPPHQTVTLLQFSTKTSANDAQPSLTTPIPPHQTVTLLQFSTKTSATCLRDRSRRSSRRRSSGSVRHPVTLTEELSRNVILLSCESTAKGGVCHVYLVGTSHRSKESKIQVRAIIDFLKPEAVFLELCSSRLKPLTKKLKKVDEISGKFEVFTVSEFGVAYEEAIKYGGRVILGDRPEEITLKRLWSNMPLWCKTRWSALYFPAVFPPSYNDLRKGYDLLIQMSRFDHNVIVHERDRFMSSTLLEVARKSRSVVAVVGRNHLQGIKRNWKQPVVLEDLLTVPSPKLEIPARRIIYFVCVAIAGVSIISELYL